jgi:urease accessory protein
MRPSRSLAAIAAAALCACAPAASAHAPSTTVADFHAGFLHALTSLEHVLAFTALGLFAGHQGSRAQPALLVLAAALLAGAALGLSAPPFAPVDLANLASGVLFGLLVAAAVALPTTAVYLLAALAGLTHGYANGVALAPPLKPWLYVPGVAMAGLLVAVYGCVIVDCVQRRNRGWMAIAVRVAGSWIAAIGILVLGLSARPLLAA